MQAPGNPDREAASLTGPTGSEERLRVPDHELLRPIDRGACGEVWLARNIMGTYRAVKIVHRDEFTNERQYEKEFEALRRFDPISRSHEGIVDVLQIGRNDAAGYYFYVMELADDVARGQDIQPERYRAQTLKTELQRHRRLDLGRCVRTGALLADAVAHLHKHQLVHRDIKPANIIFINGLPKLADIGLLTESGSAQTWVGTEGYVPPEGPGQPPADIYALGKVLYEMVTGNDRKSFPESVSEVGDAFDWPTYQELNAITIKACRTKVEERYASAREMREHLVAVEGGKSVVRLERRARLATRGMKAAALVAVLALATVVVEWMRGKYLQGQETARQQVMHQQLILERLTMTRLAPHYHGWSERCWQMATTAAQIRPTPEVAIQSVGSLRGLDAWSVARFEGLKAASVSYDRVRERWLIGTLDEGVVIKSREGDALGTFSRGRGIVACGADGRALHASLSPERLGIAIRTEGDADTAERHLDFPDFVRTHGALDLDNTELRFNPDGHVLAGLAKFQDGASFLFVWDVITTRRIFESDGPATAIAVSEDGSLLAAADDKDGDARVRLWSLGTGKELTGLPITGSHVNCLRFLFESRLAAEGVQRDDCWTLAVGDAGGTVTIWDLRNRSARAHLRGSHYDVNALCFSPDGTILVSGGRGTGKIWDTATGRLLLNLQVADFVTDIAFSSDGRQLATTSSGTNEKYPKVEIWELQDGRGIQTLLGLASQVSKLCFSPNGRLVAALDQNWEIAVWDLPTGTLLLKRKTRKSMWTADNSGLAFDPSGTQVAFAAGTQAKLWEIRSGREMGSWEIPNGLVDAMGFDPTGKLLLFRREQLSETGHPLASPRAWICRIRELANSSRMELLAEYDAFDARLFGAACPIDARFFLLEGQSHSGTKLIRSVRVLDGVTGIERYATNTAVKAEFSILLADPLGNWFGYCPTTGSNLTLVSWPDMARTKVISDFPAAIGPDAALVARPGCPETPGHGFSIFRASDNRLLFSVGIDDEDVRCPQFSPSGTHFAWGSSDGTVSVCELKAVQTRLGLLREKRSNEDHASEAPK